MGNASIEISLPHFFHEGLGLGDGDTLWHQEQLVELEEVGVNPRQIVPQGRRDGLLIVSKEGRNWTSQQVTIKQVSLQGPGFDHVGGNVVTRIKKKIRCTESRT